MNMTGEQIKAVLEEQWMGSEPRILQISGLLYTWEEQAPIGERIIQLMNENGTPIDDSQKYTVTMNEFLAEGGDGFSVFQEGTMIKEGPTELDALTQYIQGHERGHTDFCLKVELMLMLNSKVGARHDPKLERAKHPFNVKTVPLPKMIF